MVIKSKSSNQPNGIKASVFLEKTIRMIVYFLSDVRDMLEEREVVSLKKKNKRAKGFRQKEYITETTITSGSFNGSSLG